jgi:hypothetical protein
MAAAPEFKHGDLGNYADIYKLYEDGKKRRYDLLFAVNAGVFGDSRTSAQSHRIWHGPADRLVRL